MPNLNILFFDVCRGLGPRVPQGGPKDPPRTLKVSPKVLSWSPKAINWASFEWVDCLI